MLPSGQKRGCQSQPRSRPTPIALEGAELLVLRNSSGQGQLGATSLQGQEAAVAKG